MADSTAEWRRRNRRNRGWDSRSRSAAVRPPFFGSTGKGMIYANEHEEFSFTPEHERYCAGDGGAEVDHDFGDLIPTLT